MEAENEKYWQDELSTLGIECKRKMNLTKGGIRRACYGRKGSLFSGLQDYS
jgi:hypothetical protein